MLATKVAITLEACHAVDVLNEAFAYHGAPEIINSDQDSQFTALEFVETVKSRGCRLSIDGRGAWRDNISVERLWRTVKYEQVYLHAYDSVFEARRSIMRYFDWYNRSRPHSGLNNQTSNEVYYATLPALDLAA